MTEHPLVDVVRRDRGDWLFHFTQSAGNGKPSLDRIVREGGLRGSSKYILGKKNCVCFTEAPITEHAAYFRLGRLLDAGELKYQPYGVAVSKQWLFEKGGRPVIYQASSEKRELEPRIQYRHCTYTPGCVDWTWEREWRVATDFLELESDSTILVVPTIIEAFKLMTLYAEPTSQPESLSATQPPLPTPTWRVTSLEILNG